MTDSISQTIAMSVMLLTDIAVVGLFGAILHNPLPLAAQAETEVIIAAAHFERDFNGARNFEEATANLVTLRDIEGTCITWTLTETDSLTREVGSCDDDLLVSEPQTLVSRVTGSFTYLNIAGRSIVSGIPTGPCDIFYTPAECESVIPRIVSLDAEVSTGVRTTGLSASAVTEAVSLGLVLDGTENVAFPQSEIVHPSLTEGVTP